MKTVQKLPSLRVLLKKLVCYLCGLLLISVGINISKLSALGISPVSSIPRVLELYCGLTLGTTSNIITVVLLFSQFLLLRKKFRLTNLLGGLVGLLLGVMMDLTGTDPNAFGHLLYGLPRPNNYFLRLIYIVISIVVIGVGVFLYLRPHWVPMPPEGLAAAISQVSNKTFGDCKTFVDTGLITLALILQLIFLGGFSSFTGEYTAVREGTILIALLVGQVVKMISKRCATPLESWLNQ